MLQSLLTTANKMTKSDAQDAGRLNKIIFTDTFLICETKPGAHWKKLTRKFAEWPTLLSTHF